MKRLLASCLALVACTSKESAPDAAAIDVRNLIEVAIDARNSLATERFRVQLRAELGHVWARTGSIAEAKTELEAAYAEAQRLNDRGDRDRVLLRIAEGFNAAREHGRALELASKLGTPDARSEALSGLVWSTQEAAKIEQPAARDRALTRLVARAARRKNFDDARRSADKIQDPTARAHAQVFLVRGYARAKNDKLSKRITAELSGIAKSEAQSELALAAWDQGDRRAALRWLDSIEAEYVRATTMAGMKLDKKALELASNIREPALRSSAYEGIVRALVRAGAFTRALEVLDRTRDVEAQLRLRAMIAIRLIRSGELEAGARVAQAIASDPVWAPEALTAVARARAKRGDFAGALENAAVIQNLEFRLPALAEVLVRHVRSGEKPSPELKSKVLALVVEPR